MRAKNEPSQIDMGRLLHMHRNELRLVPINSAKARKAPNVEGRALRGSMCGKSLLLLAIPT